MDRLRQTGRIQMLFWGRQRRTTIGSEDEKVGDGLVGALVADTKAILQVAGKSRLEAKSD
jgi:hypothetical protein